MRDEFRDKNLSLICGSLDSRNMLRFWVRNYICSSVIQSYITTKITQHQQVRDCYVVLLDCVLLMTVMAVTTAVKMLVMAVAKKLFWTSKNKLFEKCLDVQKICWAS